MAQTYQAKRIQGFEEIDHTPSTAVAAGNVVVQNSLNGIAASDLTADELGALATCGVFDVVKATGAINAGAAVYWDADGDPVGGTAGTGAATTTSGGNTILGFAIGAAASGDEVVRLLVLPITGVTNTIHEQISNVIADPEDAGAIPVTASGHVPLVSGATGETRTLAAPEITGQLLQLHMKTDGGGDIVVTCSTGINQTGNDEMTFSDAGEVILLQAIEVGANLRWRVVSNDGVALSTA